MIAAPAAMTAEARLHFRVIGRHAVECLLLRDCGDGFSLVLNRSAQGNGKMWCRSAMRVRTDNVFLTREGARADIARRVASADRRRA